MKHFVLMALWRVRIAAWVSGAHTIKNGESYNNQPCRGGAAYIVAWPHWSRITIANRLALLARMAR